MQGVKSFYSVLQRLAWSTLPRALLCHTPATAMQALRLAQRSQRPSTIMEDTSAHACLSAGPSTGMCSGEPAWQAAALRANCLVKL